MKGMEMDEDEGAVQVFHVQFFIDEMVERLSNSVNRWLDTFSGTEVVDVRVALSQSEDEYSIRITAAVTVVTIEV